MVYTLVRNMGFPFFPVPVSVHILSTFLIKILFFLKKKGKQTCANQQTSPGLDFNAKCTSKSQNGMVFNCCKG